MLKLLSLLSLSFLLGAAPLLKTGQTKSYDQNGNEVTNDSVKDDGYYQKGVTRSYNRSGDIVIDNVTGLQWQDNNDTDNTYRTWNDANGYCAALSLGGYGDWRLPTIEELETIVDYGQYYSSITANIFMHVSSYDYWSSTIFAYNTLMAWEINFSCGNSYYYKKDDTTLYVRCVRGGTSKTSNFTRIGKIVGDNVTNLSWQDDIAAKTTKKSWIEAIEYCENLTLGGYNDWRLPNIKELLSIVDVSKSKSTIYAIFQNVSSSYYWSSTTGADDTTDAWRVFFDYGNSDSYKNKDNNHYVRCVRDGLSGDLSSAKDIVPIITHILLD